MFSRKLWKASLKKITFDLLQHCTENPNDSGVPSLKVGELGVDEPLESRVDCWKPLEKLAVSTNPFEKYARQIGNLPQGFGVNIKSIWNHHLAWIMQEYWDVHGSDGNDRL